MVHLHVALGEEPAREPALLPAAGFERDSDLAAGWSAQQSGAGHGAAGTGQVVMPSNTPGFLLRSEAVERYGRRRNLDVGNVPYYYAFGIFKIAVVLQQIYVRYHRGQTKDARFAAFEQGAELLFWRAKQVTESGRV